MSYPLVVDLDGTLIRTDSLHEMFVKILFRKPRAILEVLTALVYGRAQFKRTMVQHFEGDFMLLPFRDDLIEYIRQEKANGRSVHLISASDRRIVNTISQHLDLFDSCEGSDGIVNLKGATKAELIKNRFPDGFAYAGDSLSDINIWQEAAEIILAGDNKSVHRNAERLGKPIVARFCDDEKRWRHWLKAVRVHQWSKNMLLFVPLLLGGAYHSPEAILTVLSGFFALGLVASGTYVLNDLSDLESDRVHPTKCKRPFASGTLNIVDGLIIGPLLILVGLLLSLALSPSFAAIVFLYLLLTLSYSLQLKQIALLDTFVLGCLFTLRIIMGGVLAAVTPSEWLLTFSMFFFFSLSLAKRYVEIRNFTDADEKRVSGRGYIAEDSFMILGLGLATSVASILIIVLYLVLEAMPAGLYSAPGVLWIVPFLVTLWVLRLWFLAHRGQLHDDPVVFAIKDTVSISLGIVLAAGFAAASILG